MSGAGRFSFFYDDEEEEVPQTPIPGDFPISIFNPAPALDVPPPISETPEPAAPLDSSEPVQNTPPAASDSTDLSIVSTPENETGGSVVKPEPENLARYTPPNVPPNGASASSSAGTSVVTTPTAEEPVRPPSFIDEDVAVAVAALGTGAQATEETPPMPVPSTMPRASIPRSIRVVTTPVGSIPEEPRHETPPVVSYDLPPGASEPSEERAKFAADAFLATGNLQAASQAIAEFKSLLNAGPDLPAAKRAEVAEVLSSVLSQRFEHFGDVDDMEEAVQTQMQVAALALEDGADPALRAKSHGGLGRTLTAQFEHTGDPDDAELAIDHLNRALRMMPPGHPDRPAVLADFARAELAQYAHSDDPNRLQQALARCEEALTSVPMEAPERTPLSVLIGGALLSRFERTHSPEDIARAVEYLEFAVVHTPEGNPERPKRMRSYGDAILARSVIEGDLYGLNVAIGTHEAALELLTPEHAAYPAVTGSLAKAFHTRFRSTNNVEDLDMAIDRFKTTVEFTPFTDPNHARITDLLGKSFMAKYRAATQPPRTQFLDYAITLHRQAVALTSPDHRHYAGRLESLGKAYSKRYRSMLRRQSATESDLQEAERCLREAMSRDPSRADNILHELGKLNLQ
ncbi:hypothetical protein B0J17DRAFT_205473 [Rhizoctonia solani]|nr:hypothetical protein B0J17DRAFT_205473 [Rhizoctonia solani]